MNCWCNYYICLMNSLGDENYLKTLFLLSNEQGLQIIFFYQRIHKANIIIAPTVHFC